MKTIYLFILSCVFFSQAVSQTDTVKKEIPQVLNNVSSPVETKPAKKYLPISFGPRIGVALTQLSNNDFYGRSFRPVVNAGGFFNYHINDNFSIGTEIYFTQHAKNYDYMTKSNFIPKMMGSLYAFGLDTFLVDILLGGLTSNTATPINDTVYSYTKGTFKMSTIEMPLMGSFQYKNFKFTAGAYAALKIKTTTNEEYRDKVPLLDLIGPTLDTLINNTLGGGSGFDMASFIISPAAPNYKQAHTSTTGSVTSLASVMFGYIGDISYTFSNNVNLGVRINYPWMTYKPNVNVSYIRNTQYSASVSYLFKIKKNNKKQKTKSLSLN